MKHFYETIPHCFTFAEFYSFIADCLSDHADTAMAEVGILQGGSAAYLGVELVNRVAQTTMHLVDSSPEAIEYTKEHLKPICPFMKIQFHQGCSWEVAVRFGNESLDFVMIDADHAYESVKRDIEAWRPRVKTGGILAGHDYSPQFPGVFEAVTEAFERVMVWRGSKYGQEQRYYPVWWVRA